MTTTAIIVDLDGTLSNATARRHHMEGERPNWKAFYGAIGDDPPHAWCVEIVHAMKARGHAIIFVSGRPEEHRRVTEMWLDAQGMGDYTGLLMREAGDFRKDSEVKIDIYRRNIEVQFDILFCIDDRQQVVDAWRSLGLTCLQCAKGDF